LSSCIACPAGTYNPRSGSDSLSSCVPCPAGSYNPSAGRSSCLACPPQTYHPFESSLSSSVCTECQFSKLQEAVGGLAAAALPNGLVFFAGGLFSGTGLQFLKCHNVSCMHVEGIVYQLPCVLRFCRCSCM
jgi:hypothetical protein